MPPPVTHLKAPGKPEDGMKIPRLTSPLPMMFVPLGEEDLTKESEEPIGRIPRLEGILATLDQQLEGVRQNVVYMVEQEKTRVIKEAMALDDTPRGRATNKSMSPQESDAMLRNLAEPAQPELDYTLGELPDLRHGERGSYLPRPPINASPRDTAVHDVLIAVEFGWDQLVGYEDHIATLRRHFEECLRKERARMEDVGKKPEERIASIW